MEDEDCLPCPLLICVLGTFRLQTASSTAEPHVGPKQQELLTVLAMRPRFAIARDALLNLLWPDSDPVLSGASLNSVVYGLHKQLAPCLGGLAPVVHEAAIYRLNTAAGIDVDSARFERFVRQGDEAYRSGDQVRQLHAYRRAAALYHGDLCSTTELEAVIQRERLRAQYLTVLARLADAHYAAGRYAEALEHAHQLLKCDPCREDAHRMAMRCYVQQSERAQALHQYLVCVNVLQREFGISPEPATTELYERIRINPLLI